MPWYVVKLETASGEVRIGISQEPEGAEILAGPMDEELADTRSHALSAELHIPLFDNDVDRI